MSIGSRIKQRREELNLTQPELAKIVGVSKGSIGNYETGVSSPNEKILFKLFKALKCDANFLYQDDMLELSKNNEFQIHYLEKEIIKKYRSLDEYGKEAVDSILDIEHKRCTYIPTLSIARSTNKDDKLQIRNVPDLSQFPEDDSDL